MQPLQIRQLSFINTYSLQDFMKLHFASSDFRGRIMVGSRKKDSQSVYQVACYPVSEMADHLQKMKFVNQDYYITSNTFSGVCRNMSSLFALHNIVIDIDCHAELSGNERSYAIHELIQQYYKYTEQPGILCANTIVKTGRGIQLWWAICPVSAKCAAAYRVILDHLITQINCLIKQNPMLSNYFESIDSAPSHNLAGYFRLPGSYNTKSRNHGTFEILHPEKLDVIALANKLQIKDKRKSQFRKTVDFEILRLAKNRHKQLTKLRQIRMESGRISKGEQRDLYIFALYNSMCKAFAEEPLKKILREFNKEFQVPLPDAELFQILSTSKKKDGYAISNAWIIDQLQITEEEQAEICMYPAGDRRGSIREQERAKKRQDKLDRNEKIIDLYTTGAGSYEDIASLVGCSKETVGRVLRKSGIKRTPEQTHALILRMHDDQGMEKEEIADLLGLSERTVDRYLKINEEIYEAEVNKEDISPSEPQKGVICIAKKNDELKKQDRGENKKEKDVKFANKYLFYRGKREYRHHIIHPPDE